MDFTHKSQLEIIEYLLRNRNQRVCGKMYRHQLAFSNTDFLVTIQALSKQHNNRNLAFCLLSIGAMMLASCNNSGTENSKIGHPDPISIQHGLSGERADSKQHAPCDEGETSNLVKKAHAVPPELPWVVGVLEYVSDSSEIYSPPMHEPYKMVDQMPEFKAGMDSMKKFIRANLDYPEWESQNKIEGRLVVNFIVDKEGNIKDAKIIKSVEGSKNFDKEVLRIIATMPKWTAGVHKGNKVDVEFNLPIQFKL